MGYTALYRKFRPTTFSEMVGQDHITKTLKNQIISGRVGHAYLFNGGRGTGKTSAAKILARTINCLNPKDGEPCNECEICKAILEGSLTDVVELDAASNNSVEDVRAIREEVNFLPTLAKYRVYIIDEVHMLSTGAFNALLKTLEEPPAHVKFILATTEPQKLPTTILSRCQRFDFKKIGPNDIIKRLKIVTDESSLKVTQEALNIIAVLSEGAMRDALSILERCVQDGIDEINEDNIKELVGIPKFTYINKIIKGILEYNVEEVLATVEEILNEGKDITNIIWEMIKYSKDILIYKTTNNLNLYSKDEIEEIKKIAQNVTKEKLLNLICKLSELESDIKWSSQRTILFEAGLIKLCSRETKNSSNELEERINKLEQIITTGNYARPNNIQSNTSSVQKEVNTNRPQMQNNSAKQTVQTANIKSEDYWKDVISNLKQSGKMMLYTNLMNSTAKKISDLTIQVEFPNGLTPFGKSVLERPENMSEVTRLVSVACGKEMNIKYVDLKQNANTENKSNNIEDIAKGLDIPFNIIDE